MPRMSAQEAAQIIAQEQRALNHPNIQPTLPIISKFMRENVFSICNVGPWPYNLQRGTITMFLPAYDAKTDTDKRGYSATRPMSIMHRECRIVGGGGEEPLEYGFIEDDGRAVAADLVGVGHSMNPNNSLVRYGVFIPAGPEPAQAEIDAAKQKLATYIDQLIQEARDAFDSGPAERKAVICDRHLWAGRERGLNEAWLHYQHTEESVKCRNCGKFNPEDIARCACGHIINAELALQLDAEQLAILDRVTKPKK